MSINLELIETVRERANVTYTEAKQALEQCNNDVVEALIYLEKENKTQYNKKDSKQSSFFAALERMLNFTEKLVKKCNAVKFVISKDGQTVINLSLSIVILATLFMPPYTVIGILAALFTNHKIRLENLHELDANEKTTVENAV